MAGGTTTVAPPSAPAPAALPLTEGLAAFYSKDPEKASTWDYPFVDLGVPPGTKPPKGFTYAYIYTPGAVLTVTAGTPTKHLRRAGSTVLGIVDGPREHTTQAGYLSPGELVTLGVYDDWISLGKPLPIYTAQHDNTDGGALSDTWNTIRQPVEITAAAVAVVLAPEILPALGALGSAAAGAAPALVAGTLAAANAVAVLPLQAVAGLAVGGAEIAPVIAGAVGAVGGGTGLSIGGLATAAVSAGVKELVSVGANAAMQAIAGSSGGAAPAPAPQPVVPSGAQTNIASAAEGSTWSTRELAVVGAVAALLLLLGIGVAFA